jgi:hypothetical protein
MDYGADFYFFEVSIRPLGRAMVLIFLSYQRPAKDSPSSSLHTFFASGLEM